MITDNEEFKNAASISIEKFVGRSKSIYSDGVDFGAQQAESILTAQHDKEMEEFAEWVNSESYFDADSDWVFEGESKTISQLLQIFRERNNK